MGDSTQVKKRNFTVKTSGMHDAAEGPIKMEVLACKAKSIKFSTAETLELGYGEILREYGELTFYKLKQKLSARVPPLDVSEGVLKQWILKYRLPADAIQIMGAEDLEKRYGEAIRHLATSDCTGYKLQAALKKLSPPLYVSDQASRDWLRKYGSTEPIVQINSAGHLEMHIGKRIREDDETNKLDAERLKKWLYASA